MTDQSRWAYRVQTVGGVLGTKDEQLDAVLQEWGEEGWELVSAFPSAGTAKVTLIGKRPLSRATRRQRAWPE